MTKLRRSGDTTSYIVVLLVCEFILFPQNVFLSMASHFIRTNLGYLPIQILKLFCPLLSALEEQLKKTSGKYCVGDEISIADVALIPQIHNATR